MMKRSSYPHSYVFKASWRGTSVNLIVEAQNEKQATYKAEGRVLRMLGGVHCMDIKLIKQLR